MVWPYAIDIPEQRLASIGTKPEAHDRSRAPDTGGWSAGPGLSTDVGGERARFVGHFAVQEEPERPQTSLRALLAALPGERS